MRGFIYKIENILDGNFYIGYTKNLHSCESDHFRDLYRGDHSCRSLQMSFDNGDPLNFVFVVVSEHNGLDMNELSGKAMEYLASEYSIGYNVVLTIAGDEGSSIGNSKPCYIIDLSGIVVARFETKTDASKWLGLPNPTYLTRSSRNPKAKIRSKNDGNRYRCVNADYYEHNKDYISSW